MSTLSRASSILCMRRPKYSEPSTRNLISPLSWRVPVTRSSVASNARRSMGSVRATAGIGPASVGISTALMARRLNRPAVDLTVSEPSEAKCETGRLTGFSYTERAYTQLALPMPLALRVNADGSSLGEEAQPATSMTKMTSVLVLFGLPMIRLRFR